MSTAIRSFARDFAESRHRFRQAAQSAAAVLESFPHPLQGPDGTALATDVARFGPMEALNLLVLVSGVHGVEHYAGSACMIDWLESGGADNLPPDTAALLIHGINPWGAAHYRRYTEDNIDLARNFLDFSDGKPSNVAYESLHEAICSPDREAINVSLAKLIDEVGERDAIDALMSGQYDHRLGFAFGGTEPCWSHRLLIELITRHAAAADAVSIIEYHSGLGPFGTGMLVTMQSGEGLAKLQAAFGAELQTPRISEGLHASPGHTTDGYVQALHGKRLSSIILEFGTYPPSRSLPVLLDDHWLTHHGDPASASGREIRARNLEMHCPDDAGWEKCILARSREIISAMLQVPES